SGPHRTSTARHLTPALVLQIDERLARGIPIVPHPVAVGLEMPRGGARVHGEVEELARLGDVGRVVESHESLDAAVEVAVHDVGAADVDLRVAVVLEVEDAGVLEVTA